MLYPCQRYWQLDTMTHAELDIVRKYLADAYSCGQSGYTPDHQLERKRWSVEQAIKELVKEVEPQWQEGKIPEPMGKSVLVLEANDGKHVSFAARHTAFTGQFKWFVDIIPLEVYTKQDWYTGRWYIQPITLPCT